VLARRLATGALVFRGYFGRSRFFEFPLQPVEWVDLGLVNTVVVVDDLKCFEFEYDYSLEIFLYRVKS
jgi:hypothetical protein